MLLVGGVALDLVGAGVLSHAHNAESIVQIREEIGEEGSAVGEDDALSTQAQLLAEKRIGFLLLTVGLVLYLTGLVLKSSEETVTIGLIAVAVVLGGTRAPRAVHAGRRPPHPRAGAPRRGSRRPGGDARAVARGRSTTDTVPIRPPRSGGR